MKHILQNKLMDTNTTHTPDFVFERKGLPSKHNLIMCFLTPAKILTVNGLETAQPGDCIIHSFDFHLYHCSVPDSVKGFRNDWLHVASEPLIPIIETFRLPWNTLLPTGKPQLLTPFIRRLQSELILNDEFSENAIINQLYGMLLEIARYYKNFQVIHNDLTVTERRYFDKFVAIRTRIIENCHENINIKTLAAKVNLSQERFAVLYRKFFNKTPYSEILNARTVLAQRLLMNSYMEIKEIAVSCGWEDIHYFSRVFKKKVGISPSLYRRSGNRF